MVTRSSPGSSVRRAVVARGACAGAIAGAVAAIGDHLLARAGAAQFLPDGTGRLLGFLLALYGATGAIAGALLALGGLLLARASDLGALVAAAFHPGPDPDSPASGARLGAYAAAGLGWLVALGLAVREVTLGALLRFHGHLLIAALCGVAAAGIGAGFALLGFPLARLLSPALPFGPRLRVDGRAPPAALAAGLTFGLLGAAAGTLRLCDRLVQNPRMSHELRAWNAAIGAPLVVAAGLALGLLAARQLGRRLGDPPWARRPAATVAIAGAMLLGAAGIAILLSWPTVTLLPWKALLAGALAVGSFAIAALAGAGAGFDGRPPLARAGLILGLPAALLALAVPLGGAERVRKAATTHTGLAGPLLASLRTLSDLDRDGYAGLYGPDCNDLDPEVHPGAFDWPDDGIDQNCNGHDATATPPPRAPFAPLPPSVPARPNVLLLTIDAVRADHVGAYGYPRATTPRLDAFAKDAALFENGWAHSPSTRYSVPAILSGRYESTIAWGSPAAHWPPAVLPENRLLAEMFKEHGYRTAAILPADAWVNGHHYFDRGWGLARGFDDYDLRLETLHGGPSGNDPARAAGSSSKEMADLAIAYVEANRAAPFFLWMHFYDPHYLYERHPECPECDFGGRDLDLYDGELRFTDLHVGRLLDAVKAAGLWERTIVVVTADHGEGLGEHGVHQHGYHIYAQQEKVLFLVRAPGLAPRRIAEPVGHVDLFPSLLNLIGAPDEPQLYGRSFVDLLAGQPQAASDERVVFGEVEYEGPVVRKSVATRTHHLIDNVTPDHTVELYDLEKDPEEAHDLAGTGLAEERRLRGVLGAWMDQSALPRDFQARVAGNLSNAPLPFATALGATIRLPEGDALTVEGVDVKTPEVRAGGDAEVTLYLRSVSRIPAGWKMFTHFTAQGGQFANADHQPVENFVPLQRLRPGQHVRDRVRVGIPAHFPVGPLRVEVGLYKGPDRARTSGPGSDGDRVIAATLSVVR